MTSRRTRLATAATAVALGTAGAGGLLATSASATPSGATPSGASTAPSAQAAACDRAPWEAKVQGAPKSFGSGSPSGDYLWHDTHGFHLRVTHGHTHDQRVYTGAITSSAPMRIDRVRLEKGDKVVLSANRRTMVFEFANHGYVDGVNFHTDCARALRVSRLHIGSSNESAKKVYLGYYRQHAGSVPFSVHRYSRP